MRLRNKAGAADRHLHALALWVIRRFIVQIHNPLGSFSYTFNILHRFGWQAHHKIELDRCVACCKCDAAGFLNLIPGNIFVDNVPQPLRSRLCRKGKPAFAHLCGLFDKAFREIVHPQRRQRKADMLLRCPFVQLIQKLFKLAVVRCRKAGKAQLIVARICTKIPCGSIQKISIPLTHRAVKKPCLAKAAPAHTATQHLNAGAILDRTNHRHNKISWRRKLVHITNDCFGDHCRHTRLVRSNRADASILVVTHIIKRRDINAGDFCHSKQQFLLRDFLSLSTLNFGANGRQLVFALAQLNNVKKVRNRLSITGTRASGHYQRPAFVTVFCIKWYARQIKHGKDICVGQLILEGKTDCVKCSERVLAFHCIKRQPQPLHFRLHVQPWHKGTLAPPVFMCVEQLIKDLLPKKRHSYFVGIRKTKCKPNIYLILILVNAARLTAGISAWLLYPA